MNQLLLFEFLTGILSEIGRNRTDSWKNELGGVLVVLGLFWDCCKRIDFL